MVLRHSLTLGLLRGGFLRAPHCRRRLALRAGEGAAPEALPAASAYHTPVMGNECVDWLVTKRDGFYVDGTLGGGGHSSLILAKLGDGGRLVGVDRDAAAIEAAGDRLAADGRFSSVHANYDAGVRRAVEAAGRKADGVLLDLGVSSRQQGSTRERNSQLQKTPFSAVFRSFRLIFGRAIISRIGLEAWMLFLERARAEHSR